MKVMIATPMYNSMCTAGYTISIINLLLEGERSKKVKFNTLFALNESMIHKTRNMIVHSFLKSKDEYLLFIDSDLAFDAEQVLRMITTKKKLVCGIYPKKNISWEAVYESVKNGAPAHLLPSLASQYLFLPTPDSEPNKKGLIEVERAATGMMLIHRSVFETLADKVGSFKLEAAQQNVSEENDDIKEFFFTCPDPQTGIFLHEDFNFCRIWKETGGKIYAAPWVKLLHIGTHNFG